MTSLKRIFPGAGEATIIGRHFVRRQNNRRQLTARQSTDR